MYRHAATLAVARGEAATLARLDEVVRTSLPHRVLVGASIVSLTDVEMTALATVLDALPLDDVARRALTWASNPSALMRALDAAFASAPLPFAEAYVAALLRREADVDWADVLRRAAFAGSMQLVMEAAASVEPAAVAGNNNEALRLAVEKGYTNIVIYLLTTNAAVRDHADALANTALLLAIRRRDVQLVRLLLDEPATQRAVAAEDTPVALRVAVATGDVDILAAMLEYEVVRAQATRCSTELLRSAVSKRHRAAVAELLAVIDDSILSGP